MINRKEVGDGTGPFRTPLLIELKLSPSAAVVVELLVRKVETEVLREHCEQVIRKLDIYARLY